MAANTLERLIKTLGRGVIGVACAPKGLDIEVNEIVVHDQMDPLTVTKGDLVLGVDTGPTDAVDLVEDLRCASAGTQHVDRQHLRPAPDYKGRRVASHE